MIRRNPTLIPMSDLDVQDVRDLVARQKADTHNQHKAMAKMKRMAEKPLDDEDIQLFAQLKDVVTGLKALREKEARVGVTPQAGPSGSAGASIPALQIASTSWLISHYDLNQSSNCIFNVVDAGNVTTVFLSTHETLYGNLATKTKRLNNSHPTQRQKPNQLTIKVPPITQSSQFDPLHMQTRRLQRLPQRRGRNTTRIVHTTSIPDTITILQHQSIKEMLRRFFMSLMKGRVIYITRFLEKKRLHLL
jgi:hypothetical protein